MKLGHVQFGGMKKQTNKQTANEQTSLTQETSTTLEQLVFYFWVLETLSNLYAQPTA